MGRGQTRRRAEELNGAASTEDMVATDPLLSRELNALREELSTARRERAETAAPPKDEPTPPTPQPPRDHAVDDEARQRLNEFIDEATQFFEQAEKSIAAHPAQSVVGALLVGVLIGRLLGRR